tara:strand:+ start:382 stop:606 length:225 start_codon:yes stop_codon:yes gene_type:complete
MKLKEYIYFLAKALKRYPDAEVVYASDDEGNGYSKAHFHATLGHYDGEGFESENDAGADEKREKGFTVNAICLN